MRDCGSQRRDPSGAASRLLSRPTCAAPGVSIRCVPLDPPAVQRLWCGGVWSLPVHGSALSGSGAGSPRLVSSALSNFIERARRRC